MPLNKLQKDFSKHIFNRNKNAIIKSLPYSNQEALARLNIYRNNVFGNFSSVLSSNFEAVEKIIGEKKFQKLVEEYQKKYPSKSGNLDLYSNNFPKFLKDKKPAFLSELAKLELDYNNCYFAKDCKDFDIEKFQKLSPNDFSNLKLDLHPSCILTRSIFPVFTIWKNPNKKHKSIKKTELILIERGDGSCKINKLSEIEFLFLENLSKKKTLYQTYQKIVKLTKKEFDIGKILNKFINNRIIINFYKK